MLLQYLGLALEHANIVDVGICVWQQLLRGRACVYMSMIQQHDCGVAKSAMPVQWKVAAAGTVSQLSLRTDRQQ